MGVHVCRVRVDAETGRVEPVRYVVVQDVGRAINPAAVAGQMMGGALQGLSWGLLEGLAWDATGTPLTGSLMDYVIPRARQAPELATEIVEVPSRFGPFGAKGVGEPPIVPGIAAVSNAIRDAVGVRMTDTPFTSESVLGKIRAR
jgi:CO/xanthine dehydrogenase Mo-binding subunit